MKATRSPIDSRPAIASRPPYQRTTRTPTPPTMFITGPMNPRTRARRRFSSWKCALARAKVSTSCSSAAYAFTTWMPERFSCTRLERWPSPSWTRKVRSMSSRLVRFTTRKAAG